MSESGKVSLPMTPELKEKIKHFYALYIEDRYDLKVYKDPVVRRAYIHISELLAALEEAEKQLIKKTEELAGAELIISGHEISAERQKQFAAEQAKYVNEIGIQLREAQQTIARQREVIMQTHKNVDKNHANYCVELAEKVLRETIGEGAKES